jgi:hypothetical protein
MALGECFGENRGHVRSCEKEEEAETDGMRPNWLRRGMGMGKSRKSGIKAIRRSNIGRVHFYQGGPFYQLICHLFGLFSLANSWLFPHVLKGKDLASMRLGLDFPF